MKINLTLLAILFFGTQACSKPDQFQVNLNQSRAFLEANLLKQGTYEVESGLQYQVLKSGNHSDKNPRTSDTITAHFHGTLIDGSVFWSSVEMGEPLTVELSKLIPGCQKILSLMRPGDIWRVYIDPELAYGIEGRSSIPPNSALIFEIELISVN